jgi:hypothetical protein
MLRNCPFRFQDLEYLDLSYNELTGPVLPGLFALSKLRAVYLQRNRFTGWVPAAAAASPCLQALGLEQNLLTGEPPSGWGDQLRELRLHGNNFTDSSVARTRLRAELPPECDVTV